MKILVVDDDQNSLKFLEVLFQANGYLTELASNGSQALEKLEEESDIHCIISDILMPVLDGFELCRITKTSDRWKNIPFIFYTATYTDASDEDLAKKIGADAFMQKPLEPDAIISIVKSVLEKNEQEAPHGAPAEMTEGTLKLYNQRLVAMLEKKMLRLESEIKERRRAEDDSKKSHDQLRKLFAHLETVREDERAHVAREIHDELGQVLSYLKFDLSLLKDEISAKNDTARKKTQSIIETVEQAIRSVEDITAGLRPEILDVLDLEEAIESQAREFQEKTGIKYQFHSAGKEMSWDPQMAITVFRILQETLTNVARHSESKNIHIELSRENDNMILEVRDDGRGIPRDRMFSPKSLGLLGMRERARIRGGQVQVKSIKNRGTSVTLKMPIKNL